MMKKTLLVSIFSIFLLCGCASILSALPTVIAAVTDAALVLDAIDSFVDKYFENNPEPALEMKVEEAMNAARASLNIALRVTNGVDDLSREDAIAAFSEFKRAYEELLVLVEPLGVKQALGDQGMLSASKNVLYVPKPLALQL